MKRLARSPIGPIQGPAFTPSCDVEETDTHYLMSFDLPVPRIEAAQAPQISPTLPSNALQ